MEINISIDGDLWLDLSNEEMHWDYVLIENWNYNCALIENWNYNGILLYHDGGVQGVYVKELRKFI